MDAFLQYLKDTRGELRHVAWPTQTQTIVYTILVALLSVGVALYLGLFDFLFTTGLTRVISILPSSYTAPVVQVQTVPATETSSNSSGQTPSSPSGQAGTPAIPGNTFQIVPEGGEAPITNQ